MVTKETINLEKLEKTNIEFLLNDRVVSTDLKVYQEDNTVTFSFYLERGDYYDGDGVLEQEMSDYIFSLLDKHDVDNLEASTPEFIDCDNQNDIYSYDLKFHKIERDSLNRGRISGRLYSKNPKKNLMRLTNDEKILIILIRSIRDNEESILFLSESDVIESYQEFVETIDEKTSYERSLENFFNEYINMVPKLDFINISKKFERLTEFAKENYFE